MSKNKEYAKLRENIYVVTETLSELSMDISKKQISYNIDDLKVILEFPKQESYKGEIEILKKEIYSILSSELQEQIKRIS